MIGFDIPAFDHFQQSSQGRHQAKRHQDDLNISTQWPFQSLLALFVHLRPRCNCWAWHWASLGHRGGENPETSGVDPWVMRWWSPRDELTSGHACSAHAKLDIVFQLGRQLRTHVLMRWHGEHQQLIATYNPKVYLFWTSSHTDLPSIATGQISKVNSIYLASMCAFWKLLPSIVNN